MASGSADQRSCHVSHLSPAAFFLSLISSIFTPSVSASRNGTCTNTSRSLIDEVLKLIERQFFMEKIDVTEPRSKKE
jgi:hypothetical protein